MANETLNLKNAIIVSGGSNGIGAAIIGSLIGSEHEILNLDIVAPLKQQHATFVQVDLTCAEKLDETLGQLSERYAIVGLVNNAGFAISHSLEDTEEGDFAKLVPLNVIAPTLLAKHAARSMKKVGWGRIVNISSRAALGKENRSAYAATKGAVTSLSKVWALELAPYGITVNTVGPGPIATDLFSKVNPPGSKQANALIRSIPSGRVGSASDIGNAVRFFLGKENGFVTGQTLYVCGGLTVGSAAV